MRWIDLARRAFALGVVLLSGSACSDEAVPSRVTLPLEEYEKLRPVATKARPSFTILDSVRLTGSFGGRLTLSLSGRTVGERAEVTFLSEVSGFSLHGCEGTALVRRAGPGLLSMIPVSDRVRVTCVVAPHPGAERLSFRASEAVLFVDARVGDGRLEPGDENEDGQAMTLFRTTQSREVQPVTATARHRITLLPDEVRFRYELALHNPNRRSTPMTLQLRSGERVERAEPSSGDEEDGTYRIEAVPGDSSLALEGRLTGDRFIPPLEATAQLLVVETHPLVKAALDGPPRRVSPAEVGLATQFRGGQGFLLHANESLGWKVSVAEALRTDDALVRRIQHRIFIGEDGQTLTEAELVVDNQGAPDLKVDVAEPLFASSQGAPTLLMPEAGGLRLPLEPGAQELVVQHRGSIPSVLGLAFCRLPLLSTAVEVSEQVLELRLPNGWRPLAVRFGKGLTWGVALRDAGLWLLLLVVLTERALAGLGLAGGRRLPLAVALAVAAVSASEVFAALLVALALCGLLWLAGRVPTGRLTFGRVVVVLALLGAFAVAMGWRDARRRYAGMTASGRGGLGAAYLAFPSAWGWFTGGLFPMPELYPRDRLTYYAQTAPPPPPKDGRAELTMPRPAPTYRGLPVRRPLPPGDRRVEIYQEAVSKPGLLVVLVASGWITSMRLLLVLAAAALVVRHRRELSVGLRTSLARLGRQRPEPTPALEAHTPSEPTAQPQAG